APAALPLPGPGVPAVPGVPGVPAAVPATAGAGQVPPAGVGIPGAVAPGAVAPGAGGVPAGGGPGAGGGAGAGSVAPGASLAGRRSGPASAEQLDADRAAVAAAAAQLTVARQNLAQAVLASPVDGTVGLLDLAVGDRVTGRAGAVQAVVIPPTRGYQVEVSVGEADVARVAVGNPVTVTPDGGGAPVEGSVASIGLLPTSSAAGPATYPVTIALPGATGPYPAGQGAAASIRLADVVGTLTVPTSAVHTDGAERTVDVLRDGEVRPVPVRVGAVGAVRTEIVSGLAAGDVVVVADPSQPLPTTGFGGLGGLRGGSGSRGPGG
ncbi:MAG TPA: hypothetical protein VEZ42_21620, partial [Pseudonocardia sp.]|nr:hypothetical protein [Pseudonocardia sp.]